MKPSFTRPLQVLCSMALCLLFTAWVLAQEEAKKADENPPAAAEKSDEPAADPADDKETTEKPESPPAAEASNEGDDPAAAFTAKLDEWKELLKAMRAIRTEYDAADEGELAPILKRWNDSLAQGEKLIDDLRTTGTAAFAAAPNEDRELTRFLVKILEDDVSRDAYENAALISQALLDNGYDNVDVFNMGAVSAFNVNEYDKAEAYLKEAQSRGNLTQPATQVAGMLDEYRGYWEREKEIRAKEAEADDLPRVKITTNRGEMLVELFENEAPGAVGNFVSLVEKKFYDGLTFHRVLENFMAQGGCPEGTGTGGPGYEIYCECFEDNYRRHFRGTLSMAHSGRDSGGSQFFVTFVPTAHLNGRHTAFGRVIEGLDVLARIQRTKAGEQGKKVVPDQIVKMEVVRKRDHEYVPNKVQ